MIEIDPRGTAIQPHPLPCPECGLTPGITPNGLRIGCVRHPRMAASGSSRLDALVSWNDMVRNLDQVDE